FCFPLSLHDALPILAFLGVLLIIYILIVGWFQNYKAPVVMMVAIPLSLIGIVIGHWLLGAFFTATSFIGMIALAGIMVRNSVLRSEEHTSELQSRFD